MDKIVSVISGIVKSTILPPIDQLATKISPTVAENVKNLGRDFHEKKGRPMIYPYTFSAKLWQFPYKYHFQHGWAVKYFFISTLALVPFFHKISKKANSPENKRTWKEIRKKWYGGGHH